MLARRVGEKPASPDLKLAEERRELALFIKSQRAEERSQLYVDSYVSRGADAAYLGGGEGYNELHGIDFYRFLDSVAASKKGPVRVLDVGCGLGYFLRDLREHARGAGYADRLEIAGTNLVGEFKVIDTASGDPTVLKPLFGRDVVRIAHGENLPYPDCHFDLVVSTMGPYTYYDHENNMGGKRAGLLSEMLRVTAQSGTISISDNRLVRGATRRHPGLDGYAGEAEMLEGFAKANSLKNMEFNLKPHVYIRMVKGEDGGR